VQERGFVFDDQLTYDRSRIMKTDESSLMVDESRISSLRKGINNKNENNELWQWMWMRFVLIDLKYYK